MESPDAITDAERLLAWSDGGCQASFRALVEKYLGMVQGVALRRTGDPVLAGEISQAVFGRLAAKASRVASQPSAAGWLHHCAWCEATSALRRESSRHRHMNSYADHLLTAGQSGPDAALHEALPHLDNAIESLPGDDQRIVLMRYFEGRGLRDIAATLGKTEAAVRKQGQRALQKMAQYLHRHGVSTSTAVLAAGLGAVLSQPVSAAAVAAISTSAAATGAKVTLLDHLFKIMNAKTKTAVITIACMALPLAWQWQRNSRLEEQLHNRLEAEGRALEGNNGVLAAAGAKPARPGVLGAKRLLSLQDLRNALFDRPLRRHTAALWQLAEGLPSEELRRLCLEAVKSERRDWQNDEVAAVLLERLGQIDPQAVATLPAELDVKQAARAMTALLPELAAINPAAAIAFLKTLADAELAGGLSDLEALGRIAAHNPAETAQLLERLPATNEASSKYARLAEVWVAEDPGKALAWANSIEFDAIRSRTLTALYRAWAVKDRGQAFASLEGIQDDSFRRKVFGEMAGQVITHDPQGAAGWARGLEGGERSYALGVLGSHVASRDPALAVKYLNEAIEGGNAHLGAPISDIGHAYALHDPAAASKWAMQFSDWWVREPAVAGVSSAWTASDPVAASKWIATLPAGDSRNNAIYNLVLNMRGADPSSAFLWASKVTGNDDKRLYLLKVATDAWTNFAPEEARAAIANLPLAASEKDSLSARLE
ncbi:MAG: sigma-70 family RNA polymerase sigma factor [Verrucomicrobiaceae bacterium]|nr:MAG: sigma-70 family RNA polymerase sigma factor [Verrucomicrobiaceae bacterium]